MTPEQLTPEQLELHLEIFQLEFELEALHEWRCFPTMNQKKIAEHIALRTQKLEAARKRLKSLSRAHRPAKPRVGHSSALQGYCIDGLTTGHATIALLIIRQSKRKKRVN